MRSFILERKAYSYLYGLIVMIFLMLGVEGILVYNQTYSTESASEYGAISSLAVFSTNCKDSDNGRDIFKRGSTSGRRGDNEGYTSAVDICTSNGIVKENYCDEKNTFWSAEFKCPSGCVNGACIKPQLSTCGNGVIEPGEECDTNNLGVTKPQCNAFGSSYKSGLLKCAKCKIDTSACTGIKNTISVGLSLKDILYSSKSKIPKKYDGYIIKFKEKPIAKYKSELENQFIVKKKEVMKQNKIDFKRVELSEGEKAKINSDVFKYKAELEKKQKIAQDDVISNLKITKADFDRKLKKQFKNTFNGIVLKDINLADLEKLKKSPSVESVYPNYEVKAFLSESVPLIGADKVWKYDAYGRICPQNEALQGSLKIIITPPDGGILSSTKVSLRDSADNTISFNTTPNGIVEFKGLQLGRYNVMMAPIGYSSTTGYFSYSPINDYVMVTEPVIDSTSQAGNEYVFQAEQAISGTGNLNVKVIDKVTKLPIFNASVQGMGGVRALSTGTKKTNSDGIAAFNNIPIGMYSIVASKTGYAFRPTYNFVSPSQTTYQTVELAKSFAEYQSQPRPPAPCLTGQGITIGIIDTGVDYNHYDLGWCTKERFLNKQCSKVIDGFDFVNNDNDPMDDQGHGTHVAATAAGNGVLKGVAPSAKIVAYKVLSSAGNGYEEDVISAIEMATDPNQDGYFDDHLDIISISLGGTGDPDDPISTAVDRAVDLGVTAVIAAGNSGPNSYTIGSPGTSRKAITIGASDKTDKIAGFSSRGPVVWKDKNGYTQTILKPDVTAPGVNICAAKSSQDKLWQITMGMYGIDTHCKDILHISLQGTSMATPHVSGIAALLKEAHPSWTPMDIKSALMRSAKDLGLDYSEQGYGRADAFKSIFTKQEPFIGLNAYEFKESSGNGNNYIETGEDASLTLDLINYGLSTQHNVIAKLESISSCVQVIKQDSYFGDLASLGTGNNLDSPFIVHISSNCPSLSARVDLTLSSDEAYARKIQLYVPSASIITVDDDGPADYKSIVEAVKSAGDGSTIYVKNGIYNERINIDAKGIKIIGENNDQTKIIGPKEEGCIVAGYLKPASNLEIKNLGFECSYGMIILFSTEVLFEDNNLIIIPPPPDEDRGYGLLLVGISNSRFVNNKIKDSGIGIYSIDGSSNDFVGNIITNSDFGFISWNTISNAYEKITDNTFKENNYGIGIASNNLLVKGNTVESSAECGIISMSYRDSLIYNNNFIDSKASACIVGPEYVSIWSQNKQGNYWSDYTGFDSNGDGIGDTPYTIDANNIDNYPYINKDGWK